MMGQLFFWAREGTEVGLSGGRWDGGYELGLRRKTQKQERKKRGRGFSETVRGAAGKKKI